MSVSSSLGKLRDASKTLRIKWQIAQQSWRDDNARQFEQRFLAPLLPKLKNVESAMGHMTSVLQKVRRDCE